MATSRLIRSSNYKAVRPRVLKVGTATATATATATVAATATALGDPEAPVLLALWPGCAQKHRKRSVEPACVRLVRTLGSAKK